MSSRSMRNTHRTVDTPVLPPSSETADDALIADAARHLNEQRLVIFPSETVYGLGADARSDKAVLAIFEAKGRPRFNPLIVHVADLAAAQEIGVLDTRALALSSAFWPGPLSLVVPKRTDSGLSDLVTAGLDSVALRVPAHPVAHKLLVMAGIPMAGPSANISETVSPTEPGHVAETFGDAVAARLYGGATECGLESTVVAVLPGEPLTLLRPGSVTRAQIEQVTGEKLGVAKSDKITSPGQMRRHYAPKARLRLNAATAQPGEVLIAFGAPPDGQRPFVNLSPEGDLHEAAAGLFAALRALDEAGHTRAAIMPIIDDLSGPGSGLGEAINDRLTRAATGDET